MKKNLLNTLAFVSLAGGMFAQLPVSQTLQNKKAVLEEFTGIYCGYCPDGHQIANGIHNADPNNVILVNIHSGGYANVAPGEPDLKTTEGTAIDGMTGMGITGYPAGDMNRTVFVGSVMANGRNYWGSWANTVKTQTAYVNVALQGTVDATTRVLTVEVQVYYTGNSPAATNSLCVFLLEDSITGPQHNYGSPILYNASNYNADGTYNHNHVLRKGLTPNTFGMTIPNTTAGSSFSTTLTYTVPQTYGAVGKTNPCFLGHLNIVAFVTESNVKTINGNRGPLTITNIPNSLDIASTNLKTEASTCAGFINPTMKFSNFGSTPVTSAVFSYSVNGVYAATYNWSGYVSPQTSSQTFSVPTLGFAAIQNNTLTVDVVSVNGSTDQNSLNNTATKIIPLTNYIASTFNMEFDFTQDQWGTESTWSIVDEVANAVVLSGGPYNQLANPGTVLHVDSFIATPNTCYKLIVNDAFGDGVNAGYGVGGYIMKAGGVPLFTSNGAYGTGETKWFKTDTVTAPTNTNVATGIAQQANNIKAVSLYPNPASNSTNLSLSLTQNENIGITVMNSVGQVVYSSKATSYSAGDHTISLNTDNWASGVYFVNVSSTNGSTKRKLTVSH